MRSLSGLLGLLLLAPFGALAQTSELDTLALEPVVLEATRLKTPDKQSTLAVSALDARQLKQGQQQLSLNESLDFVPGVFALNAHNFSQDLRVSIRGFGARAAFGIRGIRLMVDGLPESTPDGQAQVDNLDLGIMNRLEVVRGPASSMYGNASGGVLNLRTDPVPDDYEMEARLSAGSQGFQRYQLKVGQRNEEWGYLVYGSHTRLDGYRDHSQVENTFFNAKIQYLGDSTSRLTFLLNYFNSPLANDAGGLTLTEVEENREQARGRNLQFQGGETVQQGRAGLSWQKDLGEKHEFSTRAYVLFRDFANALPFSGGGIVDLDRTYLGLGASYTYRDQLGKNPYRLQIGVDLDEQTDDRLRFNNNGGERGNKSFDQEERFSSLGTYLLQELNVGKLFFNLGARYDRVKLSAQDRFLIDGNQTGDLSYDRFSPMGGISLALNPFLSTYVNVSTSFETPTLSELSSNPSDLGGFNDDLKPQRATNYEIGVKGIGGSNIRFSTALFVINLQNELVPFELEAFPGRTFFRNAGSSTRTGVEGDVQFFVNSALSFQATYTWSDFTYDSYQTPDAVFDGNRLPAIPQHMGLLGINYFPRSGFYARAWMRWNGSMFANDANTETIEAYSTVNFRLGYEGNFEAWSLSPYVGVNNLLGTEYFDNIRINAFGGRYYEPAPTLGIFGGFSIKIH